MAAATIVDSPATLPVLAPTPSAPAWVVVALLAVVVSPDMDEAAMPLVALVPLLATSAVGLTTSLGTAKLRR